MELTKYTKHFADKFRTLARAYLNEDKPLSTTQRCCVSITAHEFRIININQSLGTNEIIFCDTLKFDDLKSLSLVLRGLSEKYELANTPVYWMLGPDDYQLNLIESIPVPANEFKTALSWRIRSLISYPIDEAVLEYFELPAKKGGQSTPLIAAVTAQKKQLSATINMLKDCGLQLATIDIPELALSNLAAVYESDEKCTAFLYFYEKMVILNISSKKLLYFTRRLNIPFTQEGPVDYEKISLEILRYFDFFRSQWRLSSPTRIFAATEIGDVQIIAKALSERLLNTVTPYSLDSSIISAANKDEIATKYLLDFGCLLRKESNNASSRN